MDVALELVEPRRHLQAIALAEHAPAPGQQVVFQAAHPGQFAKGPVGFAPVERAVVDAAADALFQLVGALAQLHALAAARPRRAIGLGQGREGDAGHADRRERGGDQ